MAEQNITNAAKNKYENLKKIIKECGELAIAFSGGVDSTFLMKVAHESTLFIKPMCSQYRE